MCPKCQKEYDDPLDRRFHAQPNACEQCGPHVWFIDAENNISVQDTCPTKSPDSPLPSPSNIAKDTAEIPLYEGHSHTSLQAIEQAAHALAEGKILALKGLGGFHLACLATNEKAITTLRQRKQRPHKPFALMAPTIEDAATIVRLSDKARQLLTSPPHPIVLCPKRGCPQKDYQGAPQTTPLLPNHLQGAPHSTVCEAPLTSLQDAIQKGYTSLPNAIAPDTPLLGVMLAYTPLHHILLHVLRRILLKRGILTPPLLIMTSGNHGGEPICLGNREALQTLHDIADGFLLHNRDILIRVDDSVIYPLGNETIMYRRARGYAPLPLALPPLSGSPLACISFVGSPLVPSQPANSSAVRAPLVSSPPLSVPPIPVALTPAPLAPAPQTSSPQTPSPQTSSPRAPFSLVPFPLPDQPPLIDPLLAQSSQRKSSLPPHTSVSPLAQGVPPQTKIFPTVMGLGAELKNTLCLNKGSHAFISQHMGDMQRLEATTFHDEIVEHFQRILMVTPEYVVHDKHPNFYTTTKAKSMGIPTLALQHHAAHAFAVLGENGITAKSLVLALDGTGYGDDGTLWGGEALLTHIESAEYTRRGAFSPLPLPGGEAAIHEPWRIAHALCLQNGIDPTPFPWLPAHGAVAQHIPLMVEKGINTPLSTSCGRLFDAVAATLGLGMTVTYEGQAAILLESLALECQEKGRLLPCPIITKEGFYTLDTNTLFIAVCEEVEAGMSPSLIARSFHDSLIAGLSIWAKTLCASHEIHHVGLTGGCFNNGYLLTHLQEALHAFNLIPIVHRELPCGDGNIAYGQVVWGTRVAGKDA